VPDAYNLYFYRDAEKDLSGIPAKDTRRIMDRIKNLRNDPRPRGCEKLSALERYRLRQGVWRILYEIDDDERELNIVKIAHRKEAYRR